MSEWVRVCFLEPAQLQNDVDVNDNNNNKNNGNIDDDDDVGYTVVTKKRKSKEVYTFFELNIIECFGWATNAERCWSGQFAY